VAVVSAVAEVHDVDQDALLGGGFAEGADATARMATT
jgi:hypothetical protein